MDFQSVYPQGTDRRSIQRFSKAGMGYQDRDYYREEDEQPRGFHFSGQRTMVINLVLLNILIFVVDAFGEPKAGYVVLNDGTARRLEQRDPALVSGVDQNGKVYVTERWLSGPLSVKANLFESPRAALTQFWQLLTAGFVHAPLGSHAQFAHLGMNMFALWMFGRDVEQKIGKWEFLRFYLTSIVAASLVWALVNYFIYGRVGAASYGASGAVSAVVILYVLNFPTRTLLLFGVAAVPAWVIGVLYIGLDIVGTLTKWQPVAYEAHLAGAAFALAYQKLGINFGKLWPRRWKMPSDWLKPKPQLKVHEPDNDPDETYRDLDEKADEILAKLHREGEHSLSRQERRILEDYSRRMRQKHR
jgi:membrane associated rhomboid family serine protease